MNRYDQHNYRGNSGRDYENRNYRRDEGEERNLSNYLSRYQERGNYYGMPDNDYEYRNVRASRGADYGNNTSGPVGGYGEHSYYNGNDRNHYRSSHPYSRSKGGHNPQSDNYNSGSSRGGSNQSNQYRYGDPNPHMDYNRNEGYERTRGTGWRSESDDSRRGASDYSRQDNSYQAGGSGRRYSDYGRDEHYNYGHGEQLTDIHTDRGAHKERRSDNDYGNQQYRRSDRDDNYATGVYSSNRAYLADHGQGRDEDMFDYTDENYPNRSPRGYGRRSGPDWSARSAIGSGRDSGSLRG